MTSEEFKELALSFPGTEAVPHFERTAFRVTGKRIFATLHEPSGSANLKLSSEEQSEFSSLSKTAIYPVPNKWGLQGWTTFELLGLSPEVVIEALDTAYKEVFKKRK